MCVFGVKLRDDDEFAELEATGNELLAEAGEVVVVGSADLFDQSVETQTLKQPGDFPAGFVGPQPANFCIFKVIVDKCCCIRETAPVEPGILTFSKCKCAYME